MTRKQAIDARYTPPEVGVCLNDLRVLAVSVAGALGGISEPKSSADFLKGACLQASFDLQVVADRVEEADYGAYLAVCGVIERLSGAASSADALSKLLELPHLGQPVLAAKAGRP